MGTSYYLGLDIGSVSVSFALVNEGKELVKTAYQFHEGEVVKTLLSLLNIPELQKVVAFSYTSSSPDIFRNAQKIDSVVAIVEAVKTLHPDIRTVLSVGGEKFSLVSFDEEGHYQNYRTNTSCAAGTGSFLDQQARRLSLSGIEEFSSIAYGNVGAVPGIASRCAVFAKTDLIHAQQEGFSLSEICDGLCKGLSVNICDTLFSENQCKSPALMIGGVSRNQAVVKHLRQILAADLIIDNYSHIFPAIGAAFSLISRTQSRIEIHEAKDLLLLKKHGKSYIHEPLELKMSDYPDFQGLESYLYKPKAVQCPEIEVDIYDELKSQRYIVSLGIDIGSTSTKACLLDADSQVQAGLYTRTAGRPLLAVQGIFEAIKDIERQKDCRFEFSSVSTTGSGRKFIGKIIGADLILDEITAHARAAYELNPEVDTIIEIGGQDAKFTKLVNGVVTFSAMNSVCAAGTGSFIEELAKRLGTDLKDFSARAEKVMAPLSSDRCTVFMERDLNYYLREGYSVNEVLASVLHSVRENYLSKVAIENLIGEKVFFQGATAKNRALVAAFEQRLGVPIMVSRYCHLTGALGAALSASESMDRELSSQFRGLDLYKQNIPVRSEVCDLCTNHCKLKVAAINGEELAYGFLCGRDYSTKQYVKEDTAFDLITYRKKLLAVPTPKTTKKDICIGLPASLHMHHDLPFWKKFFELLNIRFISSENYLSASKDGKTISQAEFCSPMQALYGHVHYLLDHADYVFLPVYLSEQSSEKDLKRQYCYYTQFSTAVTNPFERGSKILSPVIKYIFGDIKVAYTLFNELKTIFGNDISLMDVKKAYSAAETFFLQKQKEMMDFFDSEANAEDDISVVLLGRPYTVLSRGMNKGIPEIINRLGVKTYFMDMLRVSQADRDSIQDMLKAVHWHYAAKILEACSVVAKKSSVYPVLITSFKCTPDVFTLEYFKSIMEAHNKPYLILQLDEHDSSVGYETRIESALRSFRNHFLGHRRSSTAMLATQAPFPQVSRQISDIKDKTIFLPCWDHLSARLLEANLRSEGYDVRVLEETDEIIRQSLRHNTGQCIPMNSIAEQVHAYVKKYDLKPERCALWMFHSDIACNVRMYPYYIKEQFEKIDNDYAKLQVYVGNLAFFDFSLNIAVNTYFVYLFAGILRSVSCRIRPYEVLKGETDQLVNDAVNELYEVFLTKKDKEEAMSSILDRFKKIQVIRGKRPKVAIFGDMYVRDNDVMNQNLIKTIEENGGEALPTSYSDYAKIIAGPYFKRWLSEGYYSSFVTFGLLFNTIKVLEKKYTKMFADLLGDPLPKLDEPVEKILEQLHIKTSNTGESMDNVLKIYALTQHYDDIALFVQTNPAFCCPSIVTEAMEDRIEKLTGVPVVSVTYDGTGGSKNDVIIPYIQFPRKKRERLQA